MWTYDNAGNILSRKEYAYTTGSLGTATDTVNYTYGNSEWGDLLTYYDGVRVSRDWTGNTTRANSKNYTWEHGRQLAAVGVDADFAIITQPEDFYGKTGDEVRFTVEATGTDLSYRWQVSTNGGSTWGNSTAGGYTTNSMWVPQTDYNPGYLYRCKITDGDGNVLYSKPG